MIRIARLPAGRWFITAVLLSAVGVRAAGPVFTDVTATVAPNLPATTHPSVAWADYDNDGRLDFLLHGLWRNTGSVFSNVTAAAGLPGGGNAAWADYDNDGRVDVML